MKRYRIARSLAFRLTVWYSLVLTAVAILCFVAAYILFDSLSVRRADRFLNEEAGQYQRLFARDNLAGVIDAIPGRVAFTGTNDVFVRVLDESGHEVGTSNLSEWRAEVRPAARPVGAATRIETWRGLSTHGRARVLAAPLGTALIIQIGHSMQDEDVLLSELGELAIAFIALAVGVALLVGWLMARRALSRVHEVTRAAIVISGGALDQRVRITGWEDEVDLLAQSFNRMVERIETLVDGIKQTNDNIAHELRSPITRMRALAEVNLSQAPKGSEHEALAVSTLEESDRLLALINTMLDIAEVEAGVAKLAMAPVDVSEVVRDACDIFEPVADESAVTLQLESKGNCLVSGDLPKLQRAVANLIDNAIKYSPRGGAVRAAVSAEGGDVLISICDEGAGISEEDMPHIFQRFYRGEKSRTHKGYGLGLSMVLAIIDAHRGTIEASNLAQGCRFLVRLPKVTARDRDESPAGPREVGER